MSQEAVTIVRNHIEAFRRGDEAVSAAMLDADVILDTTRGRGSLGAVARGHAEVVRETNRFIGAFEDYAYEVERISDLGGGTVAVVMTERGHSKPSGCRSRRYRRMPFGRAPRARDTSRTMSEENVEIVRRMYRTGEAMSKDDLFAVLPELISEIADPEIEWVEAPNRIDGRTYRGHEGVRQAFQNWIGGFDEYTFELKEIIDCGDDVLTVAHEEGRGETSGATVSAASYQLFSIRNGKVTRFRGFSDKESALEAAGPSEGDVADEKSG